MRLCVVKGQKLLMVYLNYTYRDNRVDHQLPLSIRLYSYIIGWYLAVCTRYTWMGIIFDSPRTLLGYCRCSTCLFNFFFLLLPLISTYLYVLVMGLSYGDTYQLGGTHLSRSILSFFFSFFYNSVSEPACAHLD